MYHETFYQSSRDGKRLVDVLREQDVLVGIKVDQGLKPFGVDGETQTTGVYVDVCISNVVVVVKGKEQ